MARGSRGPQLNIQRWAGCHQMERMEEDILGGWHSMNRKADAYTNKCIHGMEVWLDSRVQQSVLEEIKLKR